MESDAYVELLEDASAMFWRLRNPIYPASALHNADFGELEKLHELEYGESFRKTADFLFADHPYNMRRGCDHENLGHESFSSDDRNAMVQLSGAALKPVGHGKQFCMGL